MIRVINLVRARAHAHDRQASRGDDAVSKIISREQPKERTAAFGIAQELSVQHRQPKCSAENEDRD
jgi:hypothetical protein